MRYSLLITLFVFGLVLAEHLEVGDEVVEVPVGDAGLVEGGHGAEAFADLGADGEGGEGFVVEGGAEAGAAAGVALVAVGHEDLSAVDESGVGEGDGAGEGFLAAGRGAAQGEGKRQKAKGKREEGEEARMEDGGSKMAEDRRERMLLVRGNFFRADKNVCPTVWVTSILHLPSTILVFF